MELIEVTFELVGGAWTTAQVRPEDIEHVAEKVASGHGVIRFTTEDQVSLLAAAHILTMRYRLPRDEGEDEMRKYGASDDQQLTPEPPEDQGIATTASAQGWTPQIWTPKDAQELREENEGDPIPRGHHPK